MYTKIDKQEDIDGIVANMKSGDTAAYYKRENLPFVFYVTKIPGGFLYETTDGDTTRPVFVPEKV